MTAAKKQTDADRMTALAGIAGDVGRREWQEGMSLIRGIVYVHGMLEESSAEDFVRNLDTLEWMMDQGVVAPKRLVIKILHSEGGEAGAAFTMLDAARGMAKRQKLSITTEAYGDVMSAAAQVVLQAGDDRAAGPSTVFLMHEVSAFSGMEKVSARQDISNYMDKSMTLMVHLMSERTGKTPDAIEDFIRRKDVSLTAKEAKKWGLIDRIIQVK